MSALDRQVGGGHYKDFEIQPVEFIEKNRLTFLQGCVIKRICRYSEKNGFEDLEKAKHEIDLIEDFEYPQWKRGFNNESYPMPEYDGKPLDFIELVAMAHNYILREVNAGKAQEFMDYMENVFDMKIEPEIKRRQKA